MDAISFEYAPPTTMEHLSCLGGCLRMANHYARVAEFNACRRELVQAARAADALHESVLSQGIGSAVIAIEAGGLTSASVLEYTDGLLFALSQLLRDNRTRYIPVEEQPK